MPVGQIYFSPEGRQKLGRIIAGISCLQIFASVALLLSSLYMISYVDKKMNVIEKYDTGALHPMIFSNVGLIIVLSLLRWKVTSACAGDDIKKRHYTKSHQIPLMVLTFLMIWVILAAGIMAAGHTQYAHKLLLSGFKESMHKYKSSIEVKEAIDTIQMRYECCGSSSYSDWFHIPWIPTQYLDPIVLMKSRMTAQNYTTDSVPFSCCDPMAQRPCIHRHVLLASKHKDYDPLRSLTIHQNNCVDTMVEFIEKSILNTMTSVIFILFGLEWVVMLLMRYLQTSVKNVYLKKDPDGFAAGYIFGELFKEQYVPPEVEEFDQEELKEM